MSVVAIPKPYRLAPHVKVCRTRDYVVTLDLKLDLYSGIPLSELPALAEKVMGLPTDHPSWQPSISNAENTSDTASLIQEMVQKEMIIPDGFYLDSEARPVIPDAKFALLGSDDDSIPNIQSADVRQFLRSSLTAHAVLKWGSLYRAVCRFQNRKRKMTAQQNPSSSETRFDLARAKSRILKFRRLRPLLVSIPVSCLYDSFAISEFLALDGLCVDWIFGVTTSPFMAHCWLQSGSTVLNDQPEYVGAFERIMTV